MTTLRIMSLPFSYCVKGIPPRGRKLRCFEIREYASVSVPEVGDAEAPLAAIVHAKGTEKRRPLIQYRCFQGQLYRQVLALNEPVPVEAFQRDVLNPHPLWQRAISNKQRCLFAPTWEMRDYPKLGHWLAGYETSILSCQTMDDLAAKFGPLGRMRDQEDNRSEREAEAQVELASRLMIVDGEMWTRAGVTEPYWEVVIDDGDRTVRIRLSATDPTLHEFPSFRLDRLDEAHAFADVLVKANVGSAVAPFEYELTFVRPEALARDDLHSNAQHSLYAVPLRWDEPSLCFESIPHGIDDLVLTLAELTDKAEGGGVFTQEEVFEIYAGIERLCDTVDYNSGRVTQEFHDDARLRLLRWSFERQVRPDIATLIDRAREQRKLDCQAVATAFP